MSENLEATRRGFAAFSRRDFDASLAEVDPDVEWHLAFRLPDLPADKRVYRGHDEVRSLWTHLLEVWDSLTLEVEEVLHDADDLLIVRSRFRGRGRGSGVEVDRTVFYVLNLREGRLLRVVPCESESEAREAAGLDG
jgi:ketosteroid isomerase-like protein